MPFGTRCALGSSRRDLDWIVALLRDAPAHLADRIARRGRRPPERDPSLVFGRVGSEGNFRSCRVGLNRAVGRQSGPALDHLRVVGRRGQRTSRESIRADRIARPEEAGGLGKCGLAGPPDAGVPDTPPCYGSAREKGEHHAYGDRRPPRTRSADGRRTPLRFHREQIGLDRVSCWIACLWILLETTEDDSVERRRDVATQRQQRRRLRANGRVHHGPCGLTRKGWSARQRLVEQRTEREDVGPDTRLLACDLLRRDVTQRPGHYTGRVERSVGQLARRGIATQLRPPGDSEIQNLDVSAATDHHVGWLDVLVDDAGFVSGRQRGGDLNGVIDRLIDRQASRGIVNGAPATCSITMKSSSRSSSTE